MQTKVHLFVDASNFARHESGGASLERLLSAVNSLRLALEDRDHQIVMIADSGLWRKFGPEDRAKYEEMIRSNEIIRSDSGVEADIPLLELARKHNGHVVTGDGFRDHERFHSWVDAPKKARLIGGVRDPIDGAWLFTERLLRKKTHNERGRDLNQVLDDIYPTVQSIARNAGIAVQDALALIEGTGIPDRPTQILQQSPAEQLRKILRDAADLTSSLAPVMKKSPMDRAEFIRFLEYKGVKYVSRNSDVFVTTSSLKLIKNWLSGSLNTLMAWKLVDAISVGDVESARRLVNDLECDNHNEAARFGRAGLMLLDATQSFDWNVVSQLKPDLLTHTVELALSMNRIDAVTTFPIARIAEIDSNKKIDVLHQFFRYRPDFEVLAHLLAVINEADEVDEEILDLVNTWLKNEGLTPKVSSKWSKRKWKTLADELAALPRCASAYAVSLYLSGNQVKAIAGIEGCDKKTLTGLRENFLEHHLETSWISSDELGLFIVNSSLRKLLSEGDFLSFVLTDDVLVTAIQKFDQIVDKGSRWLDAIVVRIIERELETLLFSLNSANQKVNLINTKVVGNG